MSTCSCLGDRQKNTHEDVCILLTPKMEFEDYKTGGGMASETG